ncbi:MAG: type I glutamate--ammonia ligase [Gammaproteobacteria bacterium]|nr:type I glutamate--ammonia ligase [Gammaproteobacteria bacterium]
MSVENVQKLVKEKHIKFIDLRFTDTLGKEQHVTIWVNNPDDVDDLFKYGKAFDGSSIVRFKSIDNSDMLLRPDAKTATIDPFFDEPTLILRCDVVDPVTMKGYDRDPRAVAQKAEAYLQKSGIGDLCHIGVEPEFFILDNVVWEIEMNRVSYSIDSKEAAWNCITHYVGGNSGHRPRIKGGYFPVPPIDSSQDIRSTMCLTASEMGLIIETHHHEVATANQVEINTKYDTLCNKADETQVLKYVVHNVANAYGKSATFMPKPLVGDNGSGMHCHMSIVKDGVNLFSGDKYAGLSDTALHFIGGIIKHARALNAFTNPTTNSYRRLVPGYEAPVMLAYSARNRSAAIRIPYVYTPKARRIEVRFPDPSANPYFAFSALLMAGLDGIKNKIHPGDPVDKDLYELSAEDTNAIPTVCGYLDEALKALRDDHQFLLEGNVFTLDLIDSYIALKEEEVARLRMITHPIEFDMYYSV